MDKQLIKEIYDFANQQNLKSFHAVGYGLSPCVSLVEIQDKRQEIKPKHLIILNTKEKSFEKDRNIIYKRFREIEIVLEYVDSELFVDL